MVEKIRQLLLDVSSLLFLFSSTSPYRQCFSKCVHPTPASEALICFLKMGDTQHHLCASESGCAGLGPGICMVHISCCSVLLPRLLWEGIMIHVNKGLTPFSQGHFLSLYYIVIVKVFIATAGSPISPFVQRHFTVTLMRCCRNRTLVYIHQPVIKLVSLYIFSHPFKNKVKTPTKLRLSVQFSATLPDNMFIFYQDLSVSYCIIS